MKIVQLCPYAMDRPGGVQRHVRDLSVWLQAAGHEVRIIAPPTPGMPPRRTGMLTELGLSRNFGTHGTAFELSIAMPRALLLMAAELRDWGAEVVHMHTPWTPMMVGQMWRKLRLPTVTTIHATLPEVQGTALIDRYIRRSARYFLTQSEAVVLPSAAPLPMLHLLLPDLKTVILPPAVDLAPWRQTAGTRMNGALQVVFLGRLEPRKGVDLLLKAWPKVAEVLPNATLTIAGDGALQDQVRASVGRQVVYAGRPDDAAARALMAKADIFVAPAPYGESYGLVLAEAMSAGAVPVAAANAGYASVLGDAHPDLLVTPGESEDLAAALVKLATNPEKLRQYSEWARDCGRQSDVSRVGPKYINLYDSVQAR